MRRTGKRSSTRAALAVLLLLTCLGARPVRALDVFTLWRQPEIPLRVEVGGWVEYRSQTLSSGRREEGLTRVACVDTTAGDDGAWVLELLPLVEEDDGTRRVLPGEGVRLMVSRRMADRDGTFLDAIVGAEQWRGGERQVISPSDLRDDPLVAASLASEFLPDHTEQRQPTTRIVQEQQLLCDQFVMTAADTQTAVLPAGRMVQTTTREVVAAVHADVPFLGLAYVSERIRAESRLDPPSRRLKAPPPQVHVEVLELIGFGDNAQAVLKGPD